MKNAGYTASVREVVSFSIPDEKGSLLTVLELLDKNEVNMEYLYSMATSADGKAFFVMRVDNNEKTENLLRQSKIKVLSD